VQRRPKSKVNRHIAVDLPMKVSAREDDDGKVWLGYTYPEAFKARFGIEGQDRYSRRLPPRSATSPPPR